MYDIFETDTEIDIKNLLEQAKLILESNRRNGYTVPSAGLYPFQWAWDSGFIAIGKAYYNLDAALQELSTLFSAQWKNGFLPHIVFWDTSMNSQYFPNYEFYQSHKSKYAHDEIQSSAITQPAIYGLALEKIIEIASDTEKVASFVQYLFPKIFAFHKYLYENRNLNDEGLIHIIHNWESGTDNLPIWDSIFENMYEDVPFYDLDNLRRDLNHVNKKQRPHNREYGCYLHMLDRCKAVDYDDERVLDVNPFIVQDPLFNAILIRSNESLIRIAQLIGEEDKIPALEKWNEQTAAAMNDKLWDEELGCYVYYDCKKDKKIREITAPGLIPIITDGVDDHKLQKIKKLLKEDHFGADNPDVYACPSYDMKSEKFESQRYWRGPAWINVNWLLMEGLTRHGDGELYNVLKRDAIELVTHYGFFEYYEPVKEEAQKRNVGYGGEEFSWSASLIIDMIKSDKKN